MSGLLTLNLPETLGKPLATTWEEAARLDEETYNSAGALSPTTSNADVEKKK